KLVPRGRFPDLKSLSPFNGLQGRKTPCSRLSSIRIIICQYQIVDIERLALSCRSRAVDLKNAEVDECRISPADARPLSVLDYVDVELLLTIGGGRRAVHLHGELDQVPGSFAHHRHRRDVRPR